MRPDGDDCQFGVPVDDKSFALISVVADLLDIFILGFWQSC